MALHVMVQLNSISALPEDVTVNSFTFLGGEAATPGELDTLIARIADFYNGVTAPGVADIASFLSARISRALPHDVKIYDLTGHLGGTAHGSPIHEGTFNLDPATNSAQLPSEVAMKLRFESIGRAAAPVETVDGVDVGTNVDRPKQRHTGGVYLGPFNDTADANAASAHSRPVQTLIDAAVNAGVRLNAPIVTAAGADILLGVWSRQDLTVRSLEAVSCDDAWDTIRRRGAPITALTRVTV